MKTILEISVAIVTKLILGNLMFPLSPTCKQNKVIVYYNGYYTRNLKMYDEASKLVDIGTAKILQGISTNLVTPFSTEQ